MRNPVANILFPSGKLTVTIDPPMSDSEEPYLTTASGANPLTLKKIDAVTVEISNATTRIVPFFFFVSSKHVGTVAHALLDQLTKHRNGS